MRIDVDRVRSDTPGCANVLHLGNAGSSLPTSSTLAAPKEYLDLEAMEGGYEAMSIANDDIEKFYGASAALLNCEPHEIACPRHAGHRSMSHPGT